MTGRPREHRLDGDILGAAADLVARGGYRAATMSAIATAAATTRPALYRRFPDRPSLIIAMLIDRFGDRVDIDTGSLATDLRALQRHQRDLFTDPVAAGALSGLLDELGRDSALADSFVQRFLAPRRASTIALLNAAVVRGEIAAGFDGEWICDLLTGPVLMRAVVPGTPPIDDGLVEATTAAALAALGYSS